MNKKHWNKIFVSIVSIAVITIGFIAYDIDIAFSCLLVLTICLSYNAGELEIIEKDLREFEQGEIL